MRAWNGWLLLGIAFTGLALRAARDTPASGAVSMIVTVEGRNGKPAPEVRQSDVMVYEGKERVPVRAWTPSRPDLAGLELYVLVDDALGDGFGGLLPDVRKFMEALPSGAAVGLAYMQHGSAVVLQPPTTDHSAAAGRLRLPLGSPGISPSPYLSVQDLVKHWHTTAPRREVLAITDGIERLGTSYPVDPYLDNAVTDAQRAGVVVHAIYAGGGGHYGHTFWRVTWAQSLLSMLADRTGGEAFAEGTITPVSLQPFLNTLHDRLAHQYLLEFVPKPQDKGGLVPVQVKTELAGADVAAAERAPVPRAER